jgi:CRP-like cAMP-binding protein
MTVSTLSFCEGLPERQIAAGEVLLELGGVSSELYVLIDGALEVSNDDVQIDVQTEPGAIFGEMAVLLGVPHTATVKAFAPSRVYVVDDGAAFLGANPQVTLFVAKLLARRLQHVTDYLVDVKRQFEDQAGHFGMVDEVLTSLLHDQDRECSPGSDRDPEVKL